MKKKDPKDIVRCDTKRMAKSSIEEVLSEMKASHENDERPTIPSPPPPAGETEEEVVIPPNPPVKI